MLHIFLTSRSPPNTALQTDKGKLSCLCIRKSHASSPLPLSLIVSRHGCGVLSTSAFARSGLSEIARTANILDQDVKIYLLICFSVAFVAVAVISLVGADHVPDWVLPSLVFGVPVFAIVAALALGQMNIRRKPAERLSQNND
jgi:hypothetical protein